MTRFKKDDTGTETKRDGPGGRKRLRGPGKSRTRISDTGRDARRKGIRTAMKKRRFARKAKRGAGMRTIIN